MKRHLYFSHFVQKFSKAKDKAFEGFSVEDKIYLTENLIATLQVFKQDPIDYGKVRALHEEVLKKYGKRVTNYYNQKLIDYFHKDSHMHTELQYELKMENAGTSTLNFNDEEHEHWLMKVDTFLNLDKQMLYLQTEPKDGTTNDGLDGLEVTRNKEFTATRRALALHFLDKHFKINPSDNKKAFAKFAHFLSGSSFDSLYEALRNPYKLTPGEVKSKSKLSYKKDLQFIRQYFVDLELAGIVADIDKEIKAT
jgi:hypothetical protein